MQGIRTILASSALGLVLAGSAWAEGDTIKILANAIVPSDDNADGMLSAAQVQVTAGLTTGDSVAVAADITASDGFTHTVVGATVDLSWDSVGASKTVIGDGSTLEVQTLTNLPALAAGQTYTLTVGGITLSSGALGTSPTVNDLLTALQSDVSYAGTAFTLSASGYNLVLTWKAIGPVADTALLASGTTIHETIGATYDSASGVLSQANALNGQQVEAGALLFEVVDPQKLRVEALAHDPAMAQQLGRASLPGSATPWQLVGSATAFRDGALPLLFAPQGRQDVPLALGQSVKLRVVYGAPVSGVALPAASVQRNSANQPVVWLHDSAELFRPWPVQIAPLNGQDVLVRDLPAGRRVVSAGAALLNQIR